MRYLASRKGPAKHLQMSLLFLLQIRTTESHPRKAALLVPWGFFHKVQSPPLLCISCLLSHWNVLLSWNSWCFCLLSLSRGGSKRSEGWSESRDCCLFCGLHFWWRKVWTPTKFCSAVQAGQVWFLWLPPTHVCLSQWLFFSFMYKTPSPYCIRWEKAFTSPDTEFFCWIFVFHFNAV